MFQCFIPFPKKKDMTWLTEEREFLPIVAMNQWQVREIRQHPTPGCHWKPWIYFDDLVSMIYPLVI